MGQKGALRAPTAPLNGIFAKNGIFDDFFGPKISFCLKKAFSDFFGANFHPFCLKNADFFEIFGLTKSPISFWISKIVKIFDF